MVKNRVCAQGLVYGKTWYTIDISTTKTYVDKIKKDDYRYNLLIKYNNMKHKVFKSRVSDYIEEDEKIFDIFGIKLYLQKEYFAEEKVVKYSDEVLMKKINNLIDEKMENIFKGNGKILERKVLKKVENDSTIDMVVFIVAEEQIGSLVQVTKDEIVETS